jgi:hypothetical protein
VRAFVVALVALVLACGSTPKRSGKRAGKKDVTAAEYQRRKARESGELDEDTSAAGKWGGWKYQGERDDCRYVFGRKCFTKREAACKAARCKTTCKVDGGGPATVTCSKP